MAVGKAEAHEPARASTTGFTFVVPCFSTVDEIAIKDHLARDHFFWLDLTAPTREDIEKLRALFGFHPLALEDALHFGQRPKLDHYQECGGQDCSPSAIHQIASPSDRSGAGLYSGPAPSVNSRCTRATPRGLSRTACSSCSAKPSSASCDAITTSRTTGTVEPSKAVRGVCARATTWRNEPASSRHVTGSVSWPARRARWREASQTQPSASSRSSCQRRNRTRSRRASARG
jgi:CorA-like Mg2+ transporter protein